MNTDSVLQEELVEIPKEKLHISLHAISGSSSPNTMRLMGMIGNQPVIILVDSGSTHNFLDPRVA